MRLHDHPPSSKKKVLLIVDLFFSTEFLLGYKPNELIDQMENIHCQIAKELPDNNEAIHRSLTNSTLNTHRSISPRDNQVFVLDFEKQKTSNSIFCKRKSILLQHR